MSTRIRISFDVVNTSTKEAFMKILPSDIRERDQLILQLIEISDQRVVLHQRERNLLQENAKISKDLSILTGIDKKTVRKSTAQGVSRAEKDRRVASTTQVLSCLF